MDRPPPPDNLDDFQLAESACIANAELWLGAADTCFESACAAVLFAHAVRELGKAVDLFRASRSLNRTVDDVLSHGREEHERFISLALEILDDSDVTLGTDLQGRYDVVSDLTRRLESFSVTTTRSRRTWIRASPVAIECLRTCIERFRKKLTAWSVEPMLKRPAEEVAPIERRSESHIPAVREAMQLQRQRRSGSRGPVAGSFEQEFLDWLWQYEPRMKRDAQRFTRECLRSRELTRTAKRKEARQRFEPYLNHVPEERRAAFVELVVRKRNKPTDIVNILTAMVVNCSEAAARTARDLLRRAERNLQQPPPND